MKKSIYFLLACTLITGLLITSSCKKNKLDELTTTSEDNALAEGLFDDVFKNFSEAAEEEGLDGGGKMGVELDYTFSSSCATISLIPPAWDTTVSPPVWNSTFPKTLTIDFGTVNCTGTDGKSRRGKIISVFTGKYNQVGTVITTTLDNYHVNDYSVDGSKTVTHNGDGSFTINVNGNVNSPDGSQGVSWVSTRTRYWIEGSTTGFWTVNPSGVGIMGLNGILDDVYEITGSASGTNREGLPFTVEITTALRVEFCGWIPEITVGALSIQPEGLKERIVDFGLGSCDRTYTVKIGTKVYSITY